MKSLRRLPLSTRLALVAIATLFPVAVLTAFSYFNERSDRQDTEIRGAEDYARGLATAIDNFAQGVESLALAASLALGGQEEPISQESAHTYLRSLEAQNELFRAIFVTDTAGKILAQGTGDDSGRDLSSRPYVQALLGGAEAVWTGGIEGIESGQLTVAYGRVIRGPEGEARGYFIAALYPVDLTQSLPAGLPSDGHLLLVDQDGRMLYSTRDPLLATIDDDVSAWAALGPARSGEEVALRNESTPVDEDDRYGVLVPIPQMGWTLGFTRSQGALDTTLRNAMLRDFAVLGAISIVSIGALLVVARQMSRPLRALATAAGDLAAGRTADIPPSRTADRDVARLQQAFADMSTAVRERETALAEQARILDTLERVAARLAGDLDFDRTIHAVTEAGVELTGGEVGAFVFAVADGAGVAGEPAALAGPGREAFLQGGPAMLSLVRPVQRQGGALRLRNLAADGGAGQEPSTPGPPAIRSYLGVPVRSGKVGLLGYLVFVDQRAALFSPAHERLVIGLASWAAIAIDNARLFADEKRTQDDLRQLNEAKDEFLGLVSHELRTPMAVMYGDLRLLRRRFDLLSQADREGLLDDASREAERLTQLTESLLAFAQIGLRGIPDRSPVALSELVAAAVETFQSANPTRHLAVRAADESAAAMGEPVYLGQVLGNLLSNAHKYSPAEELIEIEIAVQREGPGDIRIAVSDRGPGVPPDEVERIFESFYRSSANARQARGHGVGLTVCKRLIEAQDGRIWALNREGGGLTVMFTLPAVAVIETPETLEASPSI